MRVLVQKSKLLWVYALCAVFIILNTVLIVHEIYWGAIIPVLLLLVLMYIFSLDKIILLIAFLTPFSVNIRDIDFGIGVSLPTEPLMLGVLFVFLLKVLFKGKFDYRILSHPVSISIFLYLIWMVITSLTSEIPLVSFKFLLAKLWFIIPFYFIGVYLFKEYKNIGLFNWLYVISLIGVVFYTTYQHSKFNFAGEPAHWVMSPFYNDHTAYGAILAMFIPFVFGQVIDRKQSNTRRFLALFGFVILSIAFVLSFSRAAWVSLFAALMVMLAVLLKIKFKWILTFFVVVLTLFFTFQTDLLEYLEKNKQDSSADLIEHVKSISNISSDASNLERINRWQSAIRMFRERPFWGWGPGTYQFLYAPYQLSKEKTIVSTNAGDLGNAHSEYIGPLAESGVFGLLVFLGMVVTISVTALRVYNKAAKKEMKILCLSLYLGLFTYFVHGLLNNFLDSDKASVPFWGIFAIFVAMDIYHVNRYSGSKEE